MRTHPFEPQNRHSWFAKAHRTPRPVAYRNTQMLFRTFHLVFVVAPSVLLKRSKTPKFYILIKWLHFSACRLSVSLSVCLSVHPSVHPSVCHTCDPRLNSSRYRNALCTTRYSNVSSFVKPNFVVVNLGVHPEPLC